MNKVIGIDISKATFDASFLKNNKWQNKVFSNDLKGFKALLRWQKGAYVMEASGPYYLQLASYLYQKNHVVYVANPLTVRRFAQMKMYRAKTDKKDAQVIAQFGTEQQLKPWQPKAKVVMQMHQLFTAIELHQKQAVMLKRQRQTFEATGMLVKTIQQALEASLHTLTSSIKILEEKLLSLAITHYQQTMQLLTSIPGIGNKTAALLIVATDNFTKFKAYKQLIAYIGFSPRIYQSGTSVKGRGSICKLGNGLLRKLLYICTWSAKKYNKGCIEMYKRLKERGKPERVIKIALANKLIKQAFAIVKNQTMYQQNYQPKLVF